MNLTPEEKGKIYLEEKERFEVQEKLKKEQQAKYVPAALAFGCLWVVCAVIGLLLLAGLLIALLKG